MIFLDSDKLVGLTIFLVLVIGIPATIRFYWEIIKTIITGIWQGVINNPELQSLITQMFADKAKEYIIGNVAYLIVGVLLNVLPIKLNGSNAFWITYGILFLVVNGIIAAI